MNKVKSHKKCQKRCIVKKNDALKYCPLIDSCDNHGRITRFLAKIERYKND
jgi:hypothetical protein